MLSARDKSHGWLLETVFAKFLLKAPMSYIFFPSSHCHVCKVQIVATCLLLMRAVCSAVEPHHTGTRSTSRSRSASMLLVSWHAGRSGTLLGSTTGL